MKKLLKYIGIATAVLVSAVSCNKGDGDAYYGNCFIYIPQATQSGGINNYYNVPSGEGIYTYNYKVTETTVNAIMGVSRSGKQEDKAYSVGIGVDTAKAAEVATLLNEENPGKYEVIKESMYTIPARVEVPAGSYSTTYYIELFKSELSNSLYAGKVLVLYIGLHDPTTYELAKTNTEIAVLIDVDKLKSL